MLMTISMPVLDGFNPTRFIREFKRKGNPRKCPVVCLAACIYSSRPELVRQYEATAMIGWPMIQNPLLKYWIEWKSRQRFPQRPQLMRDSDVFDLIIGVVHRKQLISFKNSIYHWYLSRLDGSTEG
ncbi:histidine kinase (response regulator receiver protein) [Colletotrichum graminicola]|nr:histidine kinase (response regulator receiver protein) [Colletotrichum graminicola]